MKHEKKLLSKEDLQSASGGFGFTRTSDGNYVYDFNGEELEYLFKKGFSVEDPSGNSTIIPLKNGRPVGASKVAVYTDEKRLEPLEVINIMREGGFQINLD